MPSLEHSQQKDRERTHVPIAPSSMMFLNNMQSAIVPIEISSPWVCHSRHKRVFEPEAHMLTAKPSPVHSAFVPTAAAGWQCWFWHQQAVVSRRWVIRQRNARSDGQGGANERQVKNKVWKRRQWKVPVSQKVMWDDAQVRAGMEGVF